MTDKQWFVERPEQSNGYAYINSMKGGVGNVCTIYNYDSDEGHANAALIAAAPDMAELLHIILTQHRTNGAVSLSPTMEKRIEELLNKARGL